MQPRKQTFCLDISVKQILAKAVDVPMYKLPEGGYSFVCASSDLNVSRCITTVIAGFQRDMTAHVLAHMITPCKIPTTLPAAEYNTRVNAALYSLGVQLHALGVVQYWGIDGNGVPFEAVCNFCKTARKSCGL